MIPTNDAAADPLADVPDTVLSAVLDRLLPPVDDLPGAGTLGLSERVRRDAASAPVVGELAARVLRGLPRGYDTLDERAQVVALQEAEAADAVDFAGLVNVAYNAYYTDRRVLERLERTTGYAARPPQPLGYELEPFDESLLAKVREREPFWRAV